MTQYSRTVIPGRTRSTAAGDLEPNLFGVRNIEAEPPPPQEPIVRARGESREERRKDDVFSPLPGEARPAEPDGGNMRGNMLLWGGIAVMAVFGAVVWSAYSQGTRGPDEDVAPVLASAGPFKTKPVEVEEDAVARPALEAEVFERLEAPAVKPAEPELSGGGAAPATSASTASPGEPAYVAASVPPIRTPSPAPTTPKVETPKVSSPSVVAPTIEASGDVKVDPAKGSAISLTPKSAIIAPPKPIETPQVTAANPVASAAPARAGFVQSGPYVVQLAAPASEAAAEAEWAKRKAAAGDLFAGAEKLIVRADVNGKTVYRVRVGSFGTAAEADSFCAALKSRGGDCFRANR